MSELRFIKSETTEETERDKHRPEAKLANVLYGFSSKGRNTINTTKLAGISFFLLILGKFVGNLMYEKLKTDGSSSYVHRQRVMNLLWLAIYMLDKETGLSI